MLSETIKQLNKESEEIRTKLVKTVRELPWHATDALGIILKIRNDPKKTDADRTVIVSFSIILLFFF